MRPINLRTHNIMDYVIGAVLVLCPYIFGFSEVNGARNLFLVLSLGLVAYSLFTNYRYSVAKVIPLGTHMVMDCVAGALLILGPYVFGYNSMLTGGQTFLHLVLGAGALGLVGLTYPRTEAERNASMTDTMTNATHSITDRRQNRRVA